MLRCVVWQKLTDVSQMQCFHGQGNEHIPEESYLYDVYRCWDGDDVQVFMMYCAEKLMMLEADVVLGTLKGGSGAEIPVMAHPPDNVSDLSLESFLAEVVAATRKGHRCGIKLDFKSVDVLSPSLLQLQLLEDQVLKYLGAQSQTARRFPCQKQVLSTGYNALNSLGLSHGH
jgi:hypothetical protein